MFKLPPYLTHKNWYQSAIKDFWRNVNRLNSIKVVTAIIIQSVPFIIWYNPFALVTASLGTVAAALSETDDHPKGRLKSFIITLISFAVTTISASLLKPYPIIFGLGFIGSTILFVLIGGISERYRGISFGAILMGILTMLTHDANTIWYQQVLFLCLGTFFYGVISLFLLYRKPWRLIDEQLANGFNELSNFLAEKAKNFPEEKSDTVNKLAILNTQVVSALECCKEVINKYSQEVTNKELLIPYLQRFMLLQNLHERAASSHEKFENLTHKKEYEDFLEGFAELFLQLSNATKLVAESMLTGETYNHPVSLGWIINALEFELDKIPEYDRQLLELLLHNLKRSHDSLNNLNQPEKSTAIPRLEQDDRKLWQRLKELLSLNHPRFKYAIRLSSCFLVGYLLLNYFKLDNGEWILLTSLFVSQPTYSETRRRLLQRILGTILGVTIGVFLLPLFPTSPGQILLLTISIYCFFYWMRSNYSFAVLFITIYVLSVNQLLENASFSILLPRIVDTLIGAFLSYIAIRFLWPSWQYKKMPKLLSEAFQKNVLYYQKIIALGVKSREDYDYRLARRMAHKADNALTMAWQSMQVEPKKHKRLMDQAFVLTYLNHALLSHVSALAAQKEDLDKIDNINSITNKIDKALSSSSMEYLNEINIVEVVSLKPTLVELKDLIDKEKNIKKKQQLRLLYNIVGVANKLLKESKTLH